MFHINNAIIIVYYLISVTETNGRHSMDRCWDFIEKSHWADLAGKFESIYPMNWNRFDSTNPNILQINSSFTVKWTSIKILLIFYPFLLFSPPIVSIVELETPDKIEYRSYFPFQNGIVKFKVRAAHDAHLIFSGTESDSTPVVEVFLGGWKNTKSVIRSNLTKPEAYECETPNILNANEFRGFWVRYTDGVITAGNEGEAAAFLSWRNPEPFDIKYVGVCTGWGSTGSWIIEGNENENTQNTSGGSSVHVSEIESKVFIS